MDVKIIKTEKQDFLELLLLADEPENMHSYLNRGTLFALYDDGLKGVCVVTDEGGRNFEIQNFAITEAYQRCGYGRYLIDWVCKYHKDVCDIMHLGTGGGSGAEIFYERCGFTVSHTVKNYMLEHCREPIYENGVQITDKVCLTKKL